MVHLKMLSSGGLHCLCAENFLPLGDHKNNTWFVHCAVTRTSKRSGLSVTDVSPDTHLFIHQGLFPVLSVTSSEAGGWILVRTKR